MSIFWSLWIIVLTLACLALVCWVLFANRKVAVRDSKDSDHSVENKTTGHVYDGIEEYDNPLPRWWFNLFVGTLIFGAIYLLAYPGLGAYKGLLGWTSKGQLEMQQQEAQAVLSETLGKYATMPIEELIHDSQAMKMGVRLFANNCAVCHGADGGGNFGFPNLTDKDWLYGGSPEEILTSIRHGRAGEMPAWGDAIGEKDVVRVAEYVLKVSGQEHDADLAAKGQTIFGTYCQTCHGENAKGMKAFGAPNLTDNIWLYSGTREGIQHIIRDGQRNNMPAQKDLLRDEKIHLLAAYVYHLSFEYDEQ